MMRTEGMVMRAWGLIVLLGIGVAGCGDAGSRPASAASLSAMCQARPDGATPGCFASPSSMLCSPSQCQSLCAAGQTPVTCMGSGPTGVIPAPDSSAGCTIVPLPTPSNELFYCCPCGAP